RSSSGADYEGVHELLARADEAAAAAALGDRLLLMHAEGDEQVPISVSRDLHAAAAGSRLIAVPGGHHRSIQHDPEMTAVAVRFLTRALRPRPAAGRAPAFARGAKSPPAPPRGGAPARG